MKNKLSLISSFAEFVTVYDENGNEIVEFDSCNISKLEDSICKLLYHLKIDYDTSWV